MNENEIDNMPAGFELDALVAERVMGIPRHTYEAAAAVSDVPAYSTDIEAAWQVVELLRLFVVPWGLDDWWAVADRRNEHLALNIIGIAETAPLAICRAALKVKIA